MWSKELVFLSKYLKFSKRREKYTFLFHLGGWKICKTKWENLVFLVIFDTCEVVNKCSISLLYFTLVMSCLIVLFPCYIWHLWIMFYFLVIFDTCDVVNKCSISLLPPIVILEQPNSNHELTIHGNLNLWFRIWTGAVFIKFCLWLVLTLI